MSTDEKVADVLTKPLSCVKFEHFQDKIGVSIRISLKRGSSIDDTMVS